MTALDDALGRLARELNSAHEDGRDPTCCNAADLQLVVDELDARVRLERGTMTEDDCVVRFLTLDEKARARVLARFARIVERGSRA